VSELSETTFTGQTRRMTWEDLRLAIGEFMTSAGFAGLTALAAATIAYKGIVERGRIDKSLATEADDRARWWEALMWVWANREDLPSPVKLKVLRTLNSLSRNTTQSAMLEAAMDAIVKVKRKGGSRG
jgi:hypothetical protein